MRRAALLLSALSVQLAWGSLPPCTQDEVYQPATNTCARVDCSPEYEGARDYWNPSTRTCVSSCPSGGFDAATKVCTTSSPAPAPVPSPTVSPSPAPAPSPSPSTPSPSPSSSPSSPIGNPPASALPPLPVAGDTGGPTAVDCGAHGRLAADGTTCDCDAGWEPVADALTGSKACDSPVFEQPPLSTDGATNSSSSSNSSGRYGGSGGASATGPTSTVQMILFVVGAVGCIGLVGGAVFIVRRRRRLRANRGADDGALGARAGCADSQRTAASGATQFGGSFDPRGYRPGFDSLDPSLGRTLSPAQKAAFATAVSETQGSSLFGETTSSQFFLEALRHAATSSSTDGPAASATATQLERIELHLRAAAQAASLKAMASSADGHPMLEHRAKHTEEPPAFSHLDALCKAELGAASYAQALAKQRP